MILAILFAWFGYKKASSNGRNGFLWAVIAAGTFLITQLAVSLLLAVLVGVILEARSGTDRDYAAYNIPATILALIASIITGMLVLRYLDRVPEEDVYLPPPPPPSQF